MSVNSSLKAVRKFGLTHTHTRVTLRRLVTLINPIHMHAWNRVYTANINIMRYRFILQSHWPLIKCQIQFVTAIWIFSSNSQQLSIVVVVVGCLWASTKKLIIKPTIYYEAIYRYVHRRIFNIFINLLPTRKFKTKKFAIGKLINVSGNLWIFHSLLE